MPAPTPPPDELPASPDASSDALAPGLIHEMRQPLMGIKAGLQMLVKSLPEMAQSEEWPIVLSQLNRLEEIFNGYQNFLHPERVAGAPFDVGPVVQAAVALLRYRLRQLGGAFSLEQPPTPVQAFGSPSALTHGLVNLLNNALDSLDEVKGPKRLMLRVLPQPDGTVQVRVSDEGKGIAPSVRAGLFHATNTTKPAGKGNGLGLTVARRMLSAYGGSGRVVADDDPLRVPWARAELCLELRTTPLQSAAPGLPSVATPLPSAAPAANLKNLEVLLVEDEASIAQMLARGMTGEGARVTAVGDGSEAARLLKERRFDVLLSDKNLPGVNGLDLAEFARSRNEDMIVVIMTAYPSRESAHRAFGLFVDGYIQKPFELDELFLQLSDLRQRLAARQGVVWSPASGNAKRVAVVDSPEYAGLMAGAVEAAGGATLTAVDLRAALELPADVLIVPEHAITTEGRRAVWKARVARPGLCLVIISSSPSLAAELLAIGVRASAHLYLPLDHATLEAALAPLLGRGET